MPIEEEKTTYPPFKSPGYAREGDEPRTSKHGAALVDTFHSMIDRYGFDVRHCAPGDGWEQYDTSQDAWYYGVWVRLATRESVCYCEGDITHSQSPTDEVFRAELAAMEEFHGDPPPWAKVIDTETGQITHYIATRPGAELLAEEPATE